MIESVPVLFDYNEGEEPSPYSDDDGPKIRHKPCFVCATCHEAIRDDTALVLYADNPIKEFKEHRKLIIVHASSNCLLPYREDANKRFYGYSLDAFVWMILRTAGINRVDFFLEHSTAKERARMREALQTIDPMDK